MQVEKIVSRNGKTYESVKTSPIVFVVKPSYAIKKHVGDDKHKLREEVAVIQSVPRKVGLEQGMFTTSSGRVILHPRFTEAGYRLLRDVATPEQYQDYAQYHERVKTLGRAQKVTYPYERHCSHVKHIIDIVNGTASPLEFGPLPKGSEAEKPKGSRSRSSSKKDEKDSTEK